MAIQSVVWLLLALYQNYKKDKNSIKTITNPNQYHHYEDYITKI
jgi:hypothetical protein